MVYYYLQKFYSPQDQKHKETIEEMKKSLGCRFLEFDDGSIGFFALVKKLEKVVVKRYITCQCCKKEIGYSEGLTEKEMKRDFPDFWKLSQDWENNQGSTKKEFYDGYLWTILDVNCVECNKFIEERSIPKYQEEGFFQGKVIYLCSECCIKNKVFGEGKLNDQMKEMMKMPHNGGFRGCWLPVKQVSKHLYLGSFVETEEDLKHISDCQDCYNDLALRQLVYFESKLEIDKDNRFCLKYKKEFCHLNLTEPIIKECGKDITKIPTECSQVLLNQCMFSLLSQNKNKMTKRDWQLLNKHLNIIKQFYASPNPLHNSVVDMYLNDRTYSKGR